MNGIGFEKLTAFLNKLEQGNIHYTLSHHRDETVMVMVATPGERWEIEFFKDGSVEVERFVSSGAIVSEESLNDLFVAYSQSEDLLAATGR